MIARAFAMPMVLVLVVVVGMMSAVMLDRQSAQRLTTQRQLDWYQEHHGRLGLQEGIEAWIRSLPTNVDLQAVLPADGHYLDLKLRGGTTAVISFEERQSAILTDMAAVDAEMLEAASVIAAAVGQVYGENGPPEGLRTVGPPTLSAHTASLELMEVVVEAVTGDRSAAQGFARSIEADRSDNGGRCSAGAVGVAIADSGVDPALRATLSRLFTVRPTLYFAVVEIRDSTIGPAQARYGGYFSIATNRDPGSTDRSAFLTWESLGVE